MLLNCMFYLSNTHHPFIPLHTQSWASEREREEGKERKLIQSYTRPDKNTLYTIETQPLFFQPLDGPPIPHLKLVHAFPDALPTIQIDRGAIRFVLSGAALMAPGLTSPGGRLPDAEHALPPETVVAVKAEGKEEVCLVGMLKVGTEEIKSKGKGIVMDEGHYLGDGLWRMHLD